MCPCVVFGMNAKEVDYNCPACALAYFVPGVGCAACATVRSKIRENNGIREVSASCRVYFNFNFAANTG